jgi:hypothetical protein
MDTISIVIAGEPHNFEIDLGNGTWTSAADGTELDEADFPLIAEIDDQRYELYSDGTLAEEELP